MTTFEFLATKDYTSNFKLNVNGVATTVVVNIGDKFAKGDTIALEMVKRTTGEGYYLKRAAILESIELKVVTIDNSNVIDNVIDISTLAL